VAGVGTVNIDNRSFRLNFEVTALVIDEIFVAKVKRMFETDFDQFDNKTGCGSGCFRGVPYLTAPILGLFFQNI